MCGCRSWNRSHAADKVSPEIVETTFTDDSRFGVPIYTAADAARNLGVPESTFRSWSHGYVRHTSSNQVRSEGFVTTRPATRGHPVIPFVGLVEGMVAAAFRKAGVPLQQLRRALRILEDQIGLEHALASRRLSTDGGRILYDYTQKEGYEELAVVVTGQRVFADVVRDYLTRISYAPDDYAHRLVLPVTSKPLIEVDPQRNFGRPRFIHGGAPVAAVLDRFRAGESLSDVAKDFGVSQADIEDVLRAALPEAA